MTVETASPRAAGWPSARRFEPTAPYWLAMLLASAFGTNLGDYLAHLLPWGLAGSAAAALAATAALVLFDRAAPSLASFWVAIVLLRALATNIGDYLSDEMKIGGLTASLAFGAATLLAGRFTSSGRSPDVDLRYWLAMALGGVFGTVAGDYAAHGVGLALATIALAALLVAAIMVREKAAPLAALGYWAVVLAERAAGTPLGDLFASRRGFHLGLPLAMAITGGALVVTLVAWRAFRRR